LYWIVETQLDSDKQLVR